MKILIEYIIFQNLFQITLLENIHNSYLFQLHLKMYFLESPSVKLPDHCAARLSLSMSLFSHVMTYRIVYFLHRWYLTQV